VSAAGRTAAKWLSSTSNRAFVLWPIVIVAAEAALQQGVPWIEIWGLPLLACGYLQYRLVGNYRLREGGGGPGISVPPERLVKRRTVSLLPQPDVPRPPDFSRGDRYRGYLARVKRWIPGLL
jgi:hypothetical protein